MMKDEGSYQTSVLFIYGHFSGKKTYIENKLLLPNQIFTFISKPGSSIVNDIEFQLADALKCLIC